MDRRRSPLPCVTVSNIMTSNTTPDHDPAELGELERDILSIVWRLGNVTAEQVREDLDRPLKDSTVRTVLRRLEEKGYLAHTTGKSHVLLSPRRIAAAGGRTRRASASLTGSARDRWKSCWWAWWTRRCWTAPNCSGWRTGLRRPKRITLPRRRRASDDRHCF